MNNLAAERRRLGLTQRAAARELKVSEKSLGKYETNPDAMPGDFIVRAARFYHCGADYLLGLTDNRLASSLVS